jgi:tetratricopeptide (TPR) repeat protein
MGLNKKSPRFIFVLIFSLLLISASSRAAFAASTAKDYYDAGMYDEVSHGFDAAISDFSGAIDLDPNYAEAYYERGYCYNEASNRDYSKAIADETIAIELKPDFAHAYAERGYAYFMSGGRDASVAITDCNKAVELDPTFAMAYQYRGYAYGRQGGYEQEAADESTAIGLDKDLGWAYVGRAQAYNKLGQYDRALKDIRNAQDLGCAVPQDLLDSLNASAGNGSISQ